MSIMSMHCSLKTNKKLAAFLEKRLPPHTTHTHTHTHTLGMGNTTNLVFDMIPILLKASIVNIDTDTSKWTFKLWNVLNY